jgi:FdhE protein
VNVDKRVIEKLDELEKKEGSLPEVLDLYRDLLTLQIEKTGEIPVRKARITQAEAAARIRQGIPLTKWGALSIDWALAHELFSEASSSINRRLDPDASSLTLVSPDTPTLKELAKAWYEGLPLRKWTVTEGDGAPLSMALHCALRPFLRAKAESLTNLISQKQWRRGYCPVCGGKPDFSYLENNIGAKWLLCSRCDTEWLYQRVQCPYCGTQDHESLAYYPDETNVYRLYVCQKCKCYMKAIDLRKKSSETLLPLERILTTDLDIQGQEKGFNPGWAGGVGSESSK